MGLLEKIHSALTARIGDRKISAYRYETFTPVCETHRTRFSCETTWARAAFGDSATLEQIARNKLGCDDPNCSVIYMELIESSAV